MNDVTKNGYVKWSQIVPLLIPLFLAVIGFIYFITQFTMSRAEFVQFEKRFDQFTENQTTVQNSMNNQVDKMSRDIISAIEKR